MTQLILSTFLSLSFLANFDPCPPQGKPRDANDGILNILKNRQEMPTDIAPMISLERILLKGNDTERFDHNQGATIEGYVVKVEEGGIESCNCHATDPAHRDTHIYVAAKADAENRDCMIVEVTPYWRTVAERIGADWSTTGLKKSLVGKRVQFTGWMLFDSEHKQNAVNTEPSNPHAWRRSAWEIHPVVALDILQ